MGEGGEESGDCAGNQGQYTRINGASERGKGVVVSLQIRVKMHSLG